MNVISRLRALWREAEGQDLLEYALLCALIALVCYSAVQLTGTNVDALFDRIASTAGTIAGAGA
jgi:Flp pilus assembly pilin Flp